MTSRRQHWEDVYQARDHELVSWYQANPTNSLALIESCGSSRDAPLIDVGGGSSVLVDRLLERGYADVSVADLSASALGHSRTRLGVRSKDVTWIECDIIDHQLERHYAIWHDRAVFHFLTNHGDQVRYVDQVRRAVPEGGHVVMATFALDGPEQCSGLPVQRYGEQSMAHVLGDEFEAVAFVREAHETPHGSIQNFQYGLFERTSTMPGV